MNRKIKLYLYKKMNTNQQNKDDLKNEEKIKEIEEKKSLLFKEIQTKVDEKSIKPDDGIIVLKDYYLYYKNLKDTDTFSKKSKYVTFMNEEIGFKRKYFIHNQKSLEHALEEAKIKNAIIIDENKEINNSKDSKNIKESKDLKDSKNLNDLNFLKEQNDPNISKDSNVSNESNESNNLKEPKDSNSANDSNLLKEPKDLNIAKNSKVSNDSISSSQSSNSLNVDDILKEQDIIIKQDKNIKLLKIFTKNKFEGRFVLGKVKELDFNFKKYYDFPINKDSNIDKLNINKIWLQEFVTFYNEKGTNFELIIMGPRGIGKSINILFYLNAFNIPRLYFPIKKLIKLKDRKLKKMALNETIYIFNSQNEMEEFKNYCNNIPDEKDIIQFIYKYIDFILKFYERRKLKKKILIVLDDYDDSLDPFNSILNIEDLVYKNNNKILLCILGSCPFIYKRYYNYILDKRQKYKATIWDLPFKEEKDILKLPLYNYRYNNNMKQDKIIFESVIKEEISNDFKKIELKNFFCLSKYLNIFVNITQLKRDFEYFPFEFLNLENDEKNEHLIKISFKLLIYKGVFLESIKGLLKIDNIKSTFNLNKNDNDNQKDGVQFEDIIVEQLWNNSLGLYEYPEKNKIRVIDIFSIKNYNGESHEIEKDKNVIIRQTQFCGKFYDLLLIINRNGKTYGIFIQIGLNKTRYDIEQYYNNLVKYNDNYIQGIKNLLNIEINEIGFLLIFDYEKQVLFKKSNKTQGVGYCNENKIAYLIYKNFELYENLDSKEPIVSINLDNALVFSEIKISTIDIFKNSYMDLCRNMISEKNSPCIPIEEEEKDSIIKYINSKYKNDFNELRYIKNIEKSEGLIDFGFFCDDFEQVNIIKAKTKDFKYITYKKEILKINESSKLEVVREGERNKIQDDNLEYDLYLLDKKRNRSEDE